MSWVGGSASGSAPGKLSGPAPGAPVMAQDPRSRGPRPAAAAASPPGPRQAGPPGAPHWHAAHWHQPEKSESQAGPANAGLAHPQTRRRPVARTQRQPRRGLGCLPPSAACRLRLLAAFGCLPPSAACRLRLLAAFGGRLLLGAGYRTLLAGWRHHPRISVGGPRLAHTHASTLRNYSPIQAPHFRHDAEWARTAQARRGPRGQVKYRPTFIECNCRGTWGWKTVMQKRPWALDKLALVAELTQDCSLPPRFRVHKVLRLH